MQSAVLFDLDGVLIDTEGQYTAFWSTCSQEVFPDVPDFASKVKGQTLSNIFSRFLPGDEARQHLVEQKLLDFEALMDFPEIPGAFTFAQALRQAGLKTAVVTSSNQNKMRSLRRRIPDFDSRFEHVFTAEDAARSKPFPDCYINAARFFGLCPQNCFVFEDSLNGLQAAKDSGAKVIGLTTTNPPEVIETFCSLTIPNFEGFTVEHMLQI